MSNNENTRLIDDTTHGYRGIGFQTTIDGKNYRCAVKLPFPATDKEWVKAWKILTEALNNPTEAKHSKGNELLVGNEIELEEE